MRPGPAPPNAEPLIKAKAAWFYFLHAEPNSLRGRDTWQAFSRAELEVALADAGGSGCMAGRKHRCPGTLQACWSLAGTPCASLIFTLHKLKLKMAP